ncbi:retrotransposon protein, putative, ty1-copia subclass [Tanacetum coccineum]
MGGGGFGVSATPGIDFHETFSPVVKSTTIRAILSLAVTNDWPLRQLDIQNAFLYGNLKEQVYMKQPPGFIDPQRPNHVCLLHKSLYGLKQALRAWFERLSKALFDLGFKGSKTDPSLFIYLRGDTLLYILVPPSSRHPQHCVQYPPSELQLSLLPRPL